MDPQLETPTAVPTPTAGGARLVRRLLVLLLTAAAALLTATPASAYTVASRSNVPVVPTVYQVQGAHKDIGSAVTGPMYQPWVYQSGPVVQRVAGTGAQTVQVRYQVLRWTGSGWVTHTTQSGSVTIAATATSAKAPALSVLPGTSGYFSVSLSLTWTSPIGGVLGSTTVSMNESRDYICSTTRTCSVGNGFVYVG